VGVPMINMGDEVRRTQNGNNNAYCQDNETSWFDWTLLEKHADVHRFVKLLAARRLLRGTEHERQRTSLNRLIAQADKAWHGVRLHQPDWSDQSHSVALTVAIRREQILMHLILNGYWEPLDFELPQIRNDAFPWRRWIDTALESPNDIVPWTEARAIPGLTYCAEARSVVVLYTSGNAA
jgi:isoamylase